MAHYKRTPLLVLFAILLHAHGTEGRAQEYYVSTTGNDGNPGTLANPWKTIGASAAKLKPGDLLNIRGGTYYETPSISIAGTAADPITFRSYPGERAVIDSGHQQFRVPGNSDWEPVNAALGEYRSVRTYSSGDIHAYVDGLSGYENGRMVLVLYKSAASFRSTSDEYNTSGFYVGARRLLRFRGQPDTYPPIKNVGHEGLRVAVRRSDRHGQRRSAELLHHRIAGVDDFDHQRFPPHIQRHHRSPGKAYRRVVIERQQRPLRRRDGMAGLLRHRDRKRERAPRHRHKLPDLRRCPLLDLLERLARFAFSRQLAGRHVHQAGGRNARLGDILQPHPGAPVRT